MPCRDVRVWLVDQISLRRLVPHSPKQLEIGGQPTTTSQNSAVVLNLAGHENVSSRASRALELYPITVPVILSKVGIYDDLAQASCASDRSLVEIFGLKYAFKFAWLLRVEMRAEPVHCYGQGWDAVRAPILSSEGIRPRLRSRGSRHHATTLAHSQEFWRARPPPKSRERCPGLIEETPEILRRRRSKEAEQRSLASKKRSQDRRRWRLPSISDLPRRCTAPQLRGS